MKVEKCSPVVPEHVIGDATVNFWIEFIQNNEQKIETRKKSILQVYVLHRREIPLVFSIGWIRRCDDRAPRVEGSVDSGLGNCDGLLFHYLMNRHTVQITHLVKLINTHNAPVGQNHGTCLETPFARVTVSDHSSCETNTWGSTAGGVDRQWGHIQDEPQQLRFGRGRISNQSGTNNFLTQHST